MEFSRSYLKQRPSVQAETINGASRAPSVERGIGVYLSVPGAQPPAATAVIVVS